MSETRTEATALSHQPASDSLPAERSLGQTVPARNHGLDTDMQVFFYEQDCYVLSNFSAFAVEWRSCVFPTVEHAYHWEKFPENYALLDAIEEARSAHLALKVAEANKHRRRPDWDAVKVGIMRDILRAKVQQHEYVRRKLLATGNRELIENSWRDDFWGWGPNRDGQNQLGKLWMEIRAELRLKARPDTESRKVMPHPPSHDEKVPE